MSIEKFKEYLSLYGADISRWPAGMRREADALVKDNPMMRNAVDEERAFERVLEQRALPQAPAGLADRIVAAAALMPQASPKGFGEWLQRLFGEFHLPSPVYAMSLVLMLGFALGLFLPAQEMAMQTPPGEAVMASLLYPDEGLL